MGMNPVTKVYYVANARMPSSRAYGIQLAKMCEAFLKNGASLELVVPRGRGAASSIEEFYGLHNRIPVRRLPGFVWWPRTRLGFNLNSFIFSLAATVYLIAQSLRDRRSILYTIDLDQFSFLPLLASRMPCFSELHSAKRDNAIYRIFFRSVRGLIVINERIKHDLMSRFGVPPEKILVAPNGIDIEMFKKSLSREEARRALGIPESAHAVVHTGRFYDWKGLRIIVGAARRLGGRASFYLVGGTKEEFSSVTGEREIPENVICSGYRSYPEMPRWLAAADVLLALGTKENDYSYTQTSPMKLFEYLASGRQIVASRTPANAEIVSDAEAWFYEPDSAEGLAAAVGTVFESNTEKVAIRTARPLRKAEFYSWSNRAASVMRFITSQI